MISLNGRNRTPRRISTFLPAAFISLLTMLLLAPTALAEQPWEYPDANGHNYRRSNDAPPRHIGCCPTRTAKWQRSFESDITGTPIAARNGAIYVGDRKGLLRVLVYKNGETHCARDVGGPITGSALYLHERSTVYVVANKAGRPRLAAIDQTLLPNGTVSCDVKWSTVLDSQANWEASDPTYSPANNLIYVGTCVCSAEGDFQSGVGGRGSVIAIDPDTGAIVWKTYTVPLPYNGGAVWGTPVLHEDLKRVYVGTDHAFVGGIAHENTDAILALDGTTGEIVGSFQAREGDVATASNRSPNTKLGFRAPLVVFPANGTKLVGGADKGGTFYALDPATMELKYKTDVGVGTSVGGAVGLAVDPSRTGAVHGVTAMPTTFFGIDAKSGSLMYTHPGTDPVHYGPPSFASDAVWSADSAGFVDIQDPTNGRLLGRLPLGKPSIGGVSFWRRWAFVAIGTGEGTGGGVAAFR